MTMIHFDILARVVSRKWRGRSREAIFLAVLFSFAREKKSCVYAYACCEIQKTTDHRQLL